MQWWVGGEGGVVGQSDCRPSYAASLQGGAVLGPNLDSDDVWVSFLYNVQFSLWSSYLMLSISQVLYRVQYHSNVVKIIIISTIIFAQCAQQMFTVVS
jgi:hypothetical protein